MENKIFSQPGDTGYKRKFVIGGQFAELFKAKNCCHQISVLLSCGKVYGRGFSKVVIFILIIHVSKHLPLETK